MIEVKGGKLWQYDFNRVVEVAPRRGEKLHSVKISKSAAEGKVEVATREEDGAVVADIPNRFLVDHGTITVELATIGNGGSLSIEKRSFRVENKEKPEGYVFKDNVDGVISWNSITDKPFYEETITVTDTLIWDGNTEGLEFVDELGYRISDVAPSKEDLSNGYSMTLHTPNRDYAWTDAEFPVIENGNILLFAGQMLIVITEPMESPVGFVNEGIYSFETGQLSLTINGYKGFKPMQKVVVHPIDKKYLPESLQFGSEHKEEVAIDFGETEVTGTYQDSTQFYTSWELDSLPSFVTDAMYLVEFCGGKYGARAIDAGLLNFETEDGVYTIGIHNVNNGKLKYVSFYGPNKGVTALPFTTSLKVTRKYEEVKPLDGKYLPKMDYMANLTSAPTATQFNALLKALRNAGYMA